MASFGGLGEQAERFQRILLDELAVEQDAAQTVRGLHMVFGGGEAQQGQAFLLVDGCTGPPGVLRAQGCH
jgi:hypothetical protein